MLDLFPPSRESSSGLPACVRGVLGRIKFLRTLDRIVYARDNIFFSHVAFELRLLHQLRRLFPCAAKKQSPAGGLNFVGKIADSTEARGVDGSHIAQAQDHDWRQIAHDTQNFIKLICRAEEKWSVHAKHGGVRWDIFAL